MPVGQMALDLGGERPGLVGNAIGDFGGQVLVGKIDRRFEVGEPGGHAPRPAPIQIAEPALELPHGLAALRLGLGGGEIGHRLGLGQVELAVQKRPAGEFARLGEAQPEPAQDLHQPGNDRAAAVQVKLGDILAGAAVRRRKPQHEAVVEPLAGFGIDEPSTPGQPRRRQSAGERDYGSGAVRAGQAQDRDGGTARRRRRGKYRVGSRWRRRQCAGGFWSGCSISRSTRPPSTRCFCTISSMSSFVSYRYHTPSG